MLVKIDDSCINCDMCVPECPTEAIHLGAQHYEIDQSICIQCEGFYHSPTCIDVCPLGSVAFTPINKSV
ncbi:MAG: 4Fe-4S binding protein [Cellvibrio sp.]|nr:4Fe-4S binding protein [Cellvibrio sp.]